MRRICGVRWRSLQSNRRKEIGFTKFCSCIGKETSISAPQDTRTYNVCIIVDGHLVMQRGSAECYADSDSTAVAVGDGAIAAAYGDSTAIAEGERSSAMAHAASLAQATGPRAEALAVGCKEYLKVVQTGSLFSQ